MINLEASLTESTPLGVYPIALALGVIGLVGIGLNIDLKTDLERSQGWRSAFRFGLLTVKW